MKREDVISLIRQLLTIIGGFFIGRSIIHIPITTEVIDAILGSLMSLTGIVLSIVDKNVDIEKTQGFLRHIISTIGGILVGAGRISPEHLQFWTGIITALVPIIQGIFSRKKAKLLAMNRISPHQLKGGDTVSRVA